MNSHFTSLVLSEMKRMDTGGAGLELLSPKGAFKSLQVKIENRKQHRIETWHVVLTTLMLAGAIYSAFEHRWLFFVGCLCNSISWMMMPRRNSARLVSTITINESSLAIAYRTSKQKVITLDELREIQNSEHQVLIQIHRNEELQELELKRSEFDEVSWQQILQLKSRIGI